MKRNRFEDEKKSAELSLLMMDPAKEDDFSDDEQKSISILRLN